MSPVRKTNPRTAVVAIATFAAGVIGVLILFAVAVGKSSETGSIEVKLGNERFDAGDDALRAQAIRADGPILFPDVAGGQRDIYLQHQGDDVTKGWLAFDVRRPGQARDCQLKWDRDARLFRDSCGGATIPADGAGLAQYPAEVDDKGNVIVDLNPDKRRATSTTVAPETSTTSSIKVTGATR